MLTLCWYAKGDVRVDTVPDPEIQHQQNAILKKTCAIRGLGLHHFDGCLPTMKSGDILRHKNMGEAIKLRSEVKNLKMSDRVVVPLISPHGQSRTLQMHRLGRLRNGWTRSDRRPDGQSEGRYLLGNEPRAWHSRSDQIAPGGGNDLDTRGLGRNSQHNSPRRRYEHRPEQKNGTDPCAELNQTTVRKDPELRVDSSSGSGECAKDVRKIPQQEGRRYLGAATRELT